MQKKDLKKDFTEEMHKAWEVVTSLGLRSQAQKAAIEAVFLEDFNEKLNDELREEIQFLYYEPHLAFYCYEGSFLAKKIILNENDGYSEYKYLPIKPPANLAKYGQYTKEEKIAEGWQVITLTKEEKHILHTIADNAEKIKCCEKQQQLIPGFRAYTLLAELFFRYIGFNNVIKIINQHKKGLSNMEELEKELQAKPELKQLLEATLEAQKRGVAIKDIIALVEGYNSNK